MSKNSTTDRRIKYFGAGDLATPFYIEPVLRLLDGFDETKADYDINEILELHNVIQYLENNIFPNSMDKSKIEAYKACKPMLHKAIGKFFGSITEANIQAVIGGADFDYHDDLLALLGQHKKYDSIGSAAMISALSVDMSSLLGNKELVTKYDQEIRVKILANPGNAEQLIRKYLQNDSRRAIHLPTSFTAVDARSLMEQYINADPNPNYLRLIADARVSEETGIDEKIKLLARRKHETWNDEFFKNSQGGLEYACEVAISDEQEESLKIENNGSTTKFTYSNKWLEQNSDNLSILRNFIYLFGFVDNRMLLTFPSYASQLGFTDRFLKVGGKEEYPTGVHFDFLEMSSFLQIIMYDKFLASKETRLEDAISWFFGKYLAKTFGATGFNYALSSPSSTYLEKCRHVFSEMDSIIKQFKLYKENSTIDQELLGITSASPKYKDIPSLLDNKYVYATNDNDISIILRCLFSDQSSLTYINESLKGSNLFDLLSKKSVNYDDFHEYQRSAIDHLIHLGVIEQTPEQLGFRSGNQIMLLEDLFKKEVLSFYHYPPDAQGEIDEMVNKGWLAKKAALLAEPEAKYFSFYLNQQDFCNGHDLRNKYLHGSLPNKSDENAHYKTYIIALRLFMALIIKINDEFSIRLKLAS